ncbi:MAG TPA: protein kinase, partial [Aggregicoccus sp.]|nr:protein kinase [Aggregicoccus sp.]
MHPDDDDDSLSSSDSSSGDLYFSSSDDAGGPELASTPEAGSVLPRARSAAEVFPAPGWERYQGVRLLGQGGMGRVFLAYDPRLRRNVALKFLHAGAPVRTTRFFAEARAQARVQHDRVCKVFEVGEVQGKPFIAMQYVDGKSLRALAPELTLEQKVTLLRDAAEGVHAAHRAGLIHRDLKPSNIMVERSEDGALKAYVMDFGIARDWQGEGTATGAVLGTPQYMAPEQARGEVNQLDRRADVYSLGATLYFLLTGKPPITGENGLEIISRVSSVEPASPRTLSPELPPELEAIVLKCLEKDRTQRYDSARALVEDLGRYLDGEPVLARSTGRLYRLRKRVRKHKVLVSVVAVCLLLVLVAAAQAVLTRREAVERERLARRFTERVEYIEARARYSGLSPLHDTREDRKALRASMAALEQEIAQGGALAAGPGRYSLGRGHLALGDVGRAYAHLSGAWEQGYREPRVAYALALVLGRLYQQARLEAERLRPAELREAELRKVELRYRDPALRYLKLSEGSEVPSRAYVAALLAYYEGQFDEALQRLDTGGGALPWFYEAPALRGDVLVARATQRWNQGQRDAALADFEAGRHAYARAAAIGESVPEIHNALADLEYAALLMELYGRGDITAHFQRGMEAVQRARATHSEDFASRLLESRFHFRVAESQHTRGEDPHEAIQRALSAARAAMALAPERTESRIELGRALCLWGSLRQQRGLDPREQLAAANAAFEEVPARDRDYIF